MSIWLNAAQTSDIAHLHKCMHTVFPFFEMNTWIARQVKSDFVVHEYERWLAKFSDSIIFATS